MIKRTIILAIISIFLYLELVFVPNPILGAIIIFVYLYYCSTQAKMLLFRTFAFTTQSFGNRVLSAFFVWIVLSGIGGAVVLFSTLTNLAIAIIFFVTGMLFVLYNKFFFKNNFFNINDKPSLKVNLRQLPKAKLGVLLYLLLFLAGISVLLKTESIGIVSSPWQVIDSSFIYIYFGATCVLGFLLFSRLSVRFILFLLILHSFLIHSYLPLTHKLIYGTDQWRHMAVEQQIQKKQKIRITLFDSKPKTIVQSLNPGKLAYSQLWFSESVISSILNVNLITVNKWLVPLLFAILLPLLLYRLALFLFRENKKRLALVWLSFIFFPFLSLGSMTLPVSFGFLIFLFLFTLLLVWHRQPSKERLIVLSVLALLSLFGYSLYIVLFILFWVVLALCNSNRYRTLYTAFAGVMLAISIPVLELVTKYSNFTANLSIMQQVKQFVGNITAFFLFTGPRTHDILGANFLFNQVPSYSFVSNIFTQYRILLVIFSLFVLVVVLIGFVENIRQKGTIWLSTLLGGIFVSYFIGFYILAGQKLLSRRLDLVIALMLLMHLAIGLKYIYNKIEKKKILIFVFIIVFSIISTISYSLGPDTKTTSFAQYRAMELVSKKTTDITNPCIIAKTNPLLVLEFFTDKKIVGGGFPMDGNFGQTGREEVLKSVEEKGNQHFWSKAIQLTNSDKCFLVYDEKVLKSKHLYLAESAKMINKFAEIEVWEYTKIINN